MQYSDVEQNYKLRLSSDRSLQFDSVKLESLVIADQHAAVNTFSGLVHTARQTMRVGNTRSRWLKEQSSVVANALSTPPEEYARKCKT